VGIFLYGITTIGQFSFWGNYLPRVFPTYLRGTGESFAANVGRTHDRHVGGAPHHTARQCHAGRVGSDQARVRVGTRRHRGVRPRLVTSFWLPEPKREELPD